MSTLPSVLAHFASAPRGVELLQFAREHRHPPHSDRCTRDPADHPGVLAGHLGGFRDPHRRQVDGPTEFQRREVVLRQESLPVLRVQDLSAILRSSPPTVLTCEIQS
ncbi:hypothetical protein ACWDKQ_11140 [Saccharopolyspora sp. NPDC000995]